VLAGAPFWCASVAIPRRSHTRTDVLAGPTVLVRPRRVFATAPHQNRCAPVPVFLAAGIAFSRRSCTRTDVLAGPTVLVRPRRDIATFSRKNGWVRPASGAALRIYGPAMGTNQRSQIEMSDAEVAAFVAGSRTCTMATIGPDGTPHLVAMWFAVIDGQVWFETKAKSQKAVNLRRDPRITVLMEDGLTYDSLRGVSLEGRTEIIDDQEQLFQVGVSVWERYTGPYTDDCRPLVEMMVQKRVAVRVDVDRTRSWDHTKLGLDPIPMGGTTAPPAPVVRSDGRPFPSPSSEDR